MKYIPYTGTDQIKFGMTRKEIRQILNLDFSSFRRNEFAENTTDFFPSLELFVEYDKNDICEALEFTKEGNLIWKGIDLCKSHFSQLTAKLDLVSSDIEEEESTKTYHDLGITISVGKEEDEIETVMVFSKNYW